MIVLAKVGLYGLFLNYYPFHIMFGRMIPYGTYLFLALIAAGVIGDAVKHRDGKIIIDRENCYWLLYLLASLITSIFAVNTSASVQSLEKYAIRLFITIAVVYVCKYDRSVKFAVSLLAVTAVLSAATAWIRMDGLYGRLSLTSGASISVNDFGSIVAYGCFAVIPFFRYMHLKSDFGRAALTIGATVILLTEIFVAGSKKSFFAVAILYALLLIFVWFRTRTEKRSRILGILMLLLIAAAVVTVFLLPHLQETSLYMRIWGRKAEESMASDEVRWGMYMDAFRDFIENPLFGLGFDGYNVVHRNYTHSTFVEPLACSGLLSILYYTPLIGIFINQRRLAGIERRNKPKYYIETELMIFYIVFLLVGVGIPYMYKDVPCIVFGMMIAHHHIEHDTVLHELRDDYA